MVTPAGLDYLAQQLLPFFLVHISWPDESAVVQAVYGEPMEIVVPLPPEGPSLRF